MKKVIFPIDFPFIQLNQMIFQMNNMIFQVNKVFIHMIEENNHMNEEQKRVNHWRKTNIHAYNQVGLSVIFVPLTDML